MEFGNGALRCIDRKHSILQRPKSVYKIKMASMAAQLLDELMGRNRNALPTDRTKELSYNDAEVGNPNNYSIRMKI